MNHIPGPVADSVERALSALAVPSHILAVTAVSGGCINHGARLDVEQGRAFFLKWNASAPPSMFEAESDGLTALRAAGALRAPVPVARGGGAGVPGWFLMEYVAPGRRGADFEASFGLGLAALHHAPVEARIGWHHANWIGSLPQSNTPSSSWAAFWRDERIIPQLERARADGHFSGHGGKVLDDLVDAIPRALTDVDTAPPALLHGDLWNGNVYPGPDGEPVIIDPAVYRGHREVDLAMTELFGGFGAAFYEAYDEAAGIEPAYRAYRRDLYQLYYLLVHVNLFGAAYVAGAISAAEQVLAAL